MVRSPLAKRRGHLPNRSGTPFAFHRVPNEPRPECERQNPDESPDAYAGDESMNWDRIEGNWKQFTGKVKEKWGKLTDDELAEIGGKKDQLVGKIQERYGYERDRAERELDEATSAW
jgi:uncharacterized protein YjbJ (UPF0337 family)